MTTDTRPLGQRPRIPPGWMSVAGPGINNNLAAFGTMLVLMAVLDLFWLHTIAGPWHAQDLAHLAADSPNLPAAALLYAVHALGLLVFAVAPPGLRRNPPGVARAAKSGALLGLLVYASGDLMNLATLKDWPPLLSVIDIAWGAALCAACAALGKRAWDRYATT